MSSTREEGLEHCLNCRWPRQGRFCANCGQKYAGHRSLGALVGEFFGELFDLDGRVARTVMPFLFRPGWLTRAYNEGRRVHFTSPLRLYLFNSLLCFVVLGIKTRFMTRDLAARGDVRVTVSAPEFTSDHWLVVFVNERLQAVQAMDGTEVQKLVLEGMLAHLPIVMFLLVPLFALMLKLVWWRRFYVDHLIFALHAHAFAFFAIAMYAIVPRIRPGGPRLLDIEALLIVGTLAYVLLGLRRAYGASWLATIGRFGLVMPLYAIALAMGALSSMLLAILID